MIIKNPYAFLIKNFRIIHLLLSVALIYIAYKTSLIYNFLNDYVKEGFYTYYANISSQFINYYIFLIILLIIFIGVVLYFLLKWKNKKTFYYTILCLYYLALFVVFIYMFDILQSIQVNSVDQRLIRIARDVSLIATIPQYLFVTYTIFRGIGFDIKKFNFNKDLVDLDINVKDNEEVELILAKDTYKYMRGIRRAIREVKYFALENRFFFIVILSVIILGAGLSVYLNLEVYNKSYMETENFIADGLNMSVYNSYITSINYKGSTINKNKSYIIVRININNNSSEDKKINTDDYRLVTKNKTYYPVLSKENYFLDLGDSYQKETFYSGEDYEYLFIYEIDNEDKTGSFIFRILNNVKLLEGNIDADYRDINLSPKSLDETVDIAEYNIEDEINLDKSNLHNSIFKVNSYLLANSFTEKYQYCVKSSECYEGNIVIKPSIEDENKMLIRLNANFTVDKSIFMAKYLSSGNDFISYFGAINYTLNNESKNTNIKLINSTYVKNNIIFIEVPKEIKTADNIKLYITIRNIRYIVILK